MATFYFKSYPTGPLGLRGLEDLPWTLAWTPLGPGLDPGPWTLDTGPWTLDPGP